MLSCVVNVYVFSIREVKDVGGGFEAEMCPVERKHLHQLVDISRICMCDICH